MTTDDGVSGSRSSSYRPGAGCCVSMAAMRSKRQFVLARVIASSSAPVAWAPRGQALGHGPRLVRARAHLPEEAGHAVHRLARDVPLVEHLQRALARLGPLSHVRPNDFARRPARRRPSRAVARSD
jgi:hypothetical protein